MIRHPIFCFVISAFLFPFAVRLSEKFFVSNGIATAMKLIIFVAFWGLLDVCYTWFLRRTRDDPGEENENDRGGRPL